MVLKTQDEENKSTLYVPDVARITRIEKLSSTEKVFKIVFDDEEKRNNFSFKPGQFVELTVFGLGEAPFSIVSNPSNRDFFKLCVRDTGSVSGALHRMEEGSKVGIRGPFGNGYFPYQKMKNHNVLLIAGGLGIAPLMSLIKYILHYREEYKRILIIYGAVNPKSILFKNEIQYWNNRGDISICMSEEKKFLPEQIFLSLERRMECGVGKCNHCHIGDKVVCIDGPVFSLWEIENLKEAI
jgi:sulfhydrogenase subunit gamma (sulfur reductase)